MIKQPLAECLFERYVETVMVFLHGKVRDYVFVEKREDFQNI